ncbi:MAG: hypothetical protein KDD82_21225, partial [Planctomycetes bacterium]|nr:hypothetical protein [Planctomycetota bacterium]
RAAELLSKVLPDTASPEPAPLRERLARLQDLLDAALADAPAEARATRALTTARRALPVYRLSLELQDVDWTARSLAQGWSFAEPQHPAAGVLAATALLAYRAPAAATPQGLERRYPDAVAALERLAAQEGPWARAAGRALERTREVDGAIERALPRVFDMHPGDPVAPPSDLPQGWELLARLRWRALGAEAVQGQLDELLAGDFLDLMRRSETLWRVHEVLVEDQELALDPTLVQAASERVVSFVNERAAEELSRPEAQDLLGEFALAYGQSWGRRAGARVSWRVINAIRAWQAGLLVNREEIALDVLLASIRLGYGYGKALDHVAKDYLQRFEHAPPDQRSGDFFLLWGMLAELLRGEEDADGEPFRDGLAREIDYHRGVAELYAAALGESLSPAERARLDVPAAVSFKAPLSPIWVTHASREVYRHTLRVALKLYRRALQSGDADTASANLGRAVWILERFVETVLTQGEELSDPPNQVRYTSRAIREMRDVAHDLPPHHGLRSWYRWRFFQLSDRVQPVLEHLVGRLADRTEAAESTEDFWSASSTSPAVTRLVHNLAREECGFLNERGWDLEALRRAQARLQQLSAAFPGEHPYALSGLAWEQALRVGQRETARQIAEAALAAALPSDADHVDDALGWRDQLHGWFAELARSEGDLAAAREHLDAALAAGRAEPAHWPPELLAALGTSRAEVDARLGGRE